MTTTMDDWLTRPGGLANRLRLLRHRADVSGRDIARAAGWGPPKVSKIEHGKQLPTHEEIGVWASVCGADERTRRELTELLDEALALHTDFRLRMRLGQAAVQRNIGEIAAAATTVRNFEVTTIPGLLQVPGYARSRLEENTRLHGADPAELDAAIAARMARQQVLYDTTKTFQFVTTEAALRLVPCDLASMRTQLDRLLMLTGPGQLEHITLHIVPFGRTLPSFPQNAFVIFDDIVSVETLTSSVTLDGEAARTYQRHLDGLVAEAASGEEAAALIRSAREQLA